MVEGLKEAAKGATIGLRRMALQMWCVSAIVGIEYMHMVKDVESSYITLTAIMLIAALGGVDAWKQGLIDKITPGTKGP